MTDTALTTLDIQLPVDPVVKSLVFRFAGYRSSVVLGGGEEGRLAVQLRILDEGFAGSWGTGMVNIRRLDSDLVSSVGPISPSAHTVLLDSPNHSSSYSLRNPCRYTFPPVAPRP